jgi:hypothetical protein
MLATGDRAGAEDRLAALRAAENAARSAGMLAAEPYGQQRCRVAAEMLVIAADSLPDLNRRPNLDGQLALGPLPSTPPSTTTSACPSPWPAGPARGRRLRADSRSSGPTIPPTPTRTARSGEGQVDFRLSRAQATYENAGAVEAATV